MDESYCCSSSSVSRQLSLLMLASPCTATVRHLEEWLGELENAAWYYAGLSLHWNGQTELLKAAAG